MNKFLKTLGKIIMHLLLLPIYIIFWPLELAEKVGMKDEGGIATSIWALILAITLLIIFIR